MNQQNQLQQSFDTNNRSYNINNSQFGYSYNDYRDHSDITKSFKDEQLPQNDRTNDSHSYFTEVFSWGSDQLGQLGLGTYPIGRSYPIPRYSCGGEHAGFITSKQKINVHMRILVSNLIYTMGSNSHGQLGINDITIKNKNSPILVDSLMDKLPISIACGSQHTIICTDKGETYSWGEGKYGALGISTTDNQNAPVSVIFQEQRNAQIQQVSCGDKHSAFMDFSGRVYVCGYNESGQLGIGTRDQENSPVLVKRFTDKAKMISCGQLHTLILTRCGHIYSFGANSFGQLGLGNKRNCNIPMIIYDINHIPMKKVAAGSFSASISESGDLYLWGTGVFGEFLTPHRVKTIHGLTIDVSIGNHFGTALTKDGQVYAWGQNSNGELGQGDFEEKPTPIQILSLTERQVTSISCGSSFVIALGQTLTQNKFILSQSPKNVDRSFTYGQGSTRDYLNSSLDKTSKTKKSKMSSRKTPKIKTSSRHQQNVLQIMNTQKSRHQIQQPSNYDQPYTPLRDSPLRSKIHKCDSHCNRCQYHSHSHQTKKIIKPKSKTKSQIDSEMIDDLQISDDALWREKSQLKNLENDINDLRIQLKETLSQNSELKNHCLVLERSKSDNTQIESEYQRIRKLYQDLEQEHRQLQNRIKDQERQQLGQKDQQIENRNLLCRIKDLENTVENQRKELINNESAIRHYSESIKGLEYEFERREQESEILKKQNQILKEALDQEKIQSMTSQTMRVQIEEESQRRKIAERECEQLRNQMQSQRAQMLMENENLRRALDDMKYQNEDNLRVINLKNEEVNYLQKDLFTQKEITSHANIDIENLKLIISDLEDKNRKLNEKLNEVIYNKASAYKQRTLLALKMNQSPERQIKAQEYGIPSTSEQRLEQVIQDEQMTTEKALNEMNRMLRQSPTKSCSDATQNYQIFKQLEKIENTAQSKEISPYRNQIDLTYSNTGKTLRREDLSETKNVIGQFNESLFNLHPITQSSTHQRRDSTNTNSYNQNNSSPLRQKIPQTILTQGKPSPRDSYQYQEQVKNQCDKLASVLGIQSPPQISFETEYQDNSRQEQQMINNQAATIMTSSMIKKSLHDLRMKLDSMKNNKEAVESGIQDFEQRTTTNL